MKDILDRQLVPSGDAAESAVGDETVILHLATGVYYGLDPIGTRIWAMLKERVAGAEICRKVAEEYDAPIDVVNRDTRKFLTDMEAQGILTDG